MSEWTARVGAAIAGDAGKAPGAPDWARILVSDTPAIDVRTPIPGAALRLAASPRLALASFEVPAADALDEAGFRDLVEQGYRTLAAELVRRSLHPLRYWNYVPGIGDTGASGLCGYDVFNQARRTAFERPEVRALGSATRVAASAVDPRSSDFSIHVLAGDCAPVPIDNPRQIEPHEYSSRYGPVPPRFARGVVVPRALVDDLGFPGALVSGTASIVGEETRHAGDIAAQLNETAVNLASVSLACSGPVEPRPIGAPLDRELEAALRHFSDLRVYLPRPENEAPLLDWIDRHFELERPPEILGADLCRPDLLVEVEGTLRSSR